MRDRTTKLPIRFENVAFTAGVVQILRGAAKPLKIREADLERYLGLPPFQTEALEEGVGIVIVAVESEAPGIYRRAVEFLRAVLRDGAM